MLTDDELRRLVQSGERFDIEFASEESNLVSDEALVEAVVCLANGRGGTILVGVEDDGRISGARPRHGEYTDARRIEALIANRTVPSCPVECAVTVLDGLAVLAITIPDGRPVTSTSGGVYRRRAFDAHGRARCLPFLAHEMQSREATRGALDHSSLVVPEARWEDLDPIEIERLRRTILRNPGRADASLLALADAEIVRALGLGEVGEGESRVQRLRVAGLLLLGREEALRRFVPTHELAFQVLRGSRVTVNEFARWPLVRAAEEMATRFDARNEEEEIEIGTVRAGIPDYSPGGFREALHNAFVHRDYTRLGAVHVLWRDDEIEIASPGGFPDEVNVGNLLVTAPRPRNPVLADAFKRIGLVERTGRGIDAIYEGQLRYGRRVPDYSRSTGGTVQVALPGGPANVALARLILEHDTPRRRVTLDEMLVLNAIERERQIEIAAAALLIQRPEEAARAVLERLVETGLLEPRHDRRERVYRLSALASRALGVSPAGVGFRGTEAIEKEQLILKFVDSHGRITRAQAAELCRVGSREARTALDRLVKRGQLLVRGQRRGAYYERIEAESVASGSKL
ncbi:MAG TPA: ATP-binding protein [Gemmatimonadaceae bacterium]|nr:ATP-binding protein [Gemmatimonadaceae bacterium]